MLKLGIIGWGYWGRNYAKYFDSSIDATLDWVCDLREEMLSDAKSRFPHLKVTKSIDDLVQAQLDGIIVVTPASLHFKLAKFLIEKRINLLIEKPLTNSSAQAIELQKLVKKFQVKVLVGHTFLYNQSVRWIKTKVESNFFGKLYYLEFKRQSYGPIRDDVNIVWDFAPHDLAITDYLLNNQLPISIKASGGIFSRHNKEDIAVVILKYPKNILVNINIAWLYPIKVRNLTLLGDKKMAVFEDTNPSEPLKIFDTSIKYPSEKEPYGAGFRLGDVSIPRLKSADPLYTQLKHFVSYLKDQENPITPINNGVRVVALLEAINYSLQQNKEINFKQWLNKSSVKI